MYYIQTFSTIYCNLFVFLFCYFWLLVIIPFVLYPSLTNCKYLFICLHWHILQMRFKRMFCICYQIAFKSVRLCHWLLLYSIYIENECDKRKCNVMFHISFKLQSLHVSNHRLTPVLSDPSRRDFSRSHRYNGNKPGLRSQ